MKFPRASGILLHLTSLPSRFGIGDFGPEAYRFVDFLHEAGQQIWQVLPLGHTERGDSPYRCFSAFAGNPLLISPELLLQQGYLDESDLTENPPFPEDRVDFERVTAHKLPLLAKSYRRFKSSASHAEVAAFDEFCRKHVDWLEDYALFMAVKTANNSAVWADWEQGIALRQIDPLKQYKEKLAAEVEALQYAQFQFFRQWTALRRYCHDRQIRIMGDIPIYVAHDSADVWAHRDLFQLDETGHPTVVAGVPPDYFSATGQLWGNPIYQWDLEKEQVFAWWIKRFQSIFELVDIVRLDHFRGFEAYWAVPASEKTAVHGCWVKAPGFALFETLQEVLGDLPIVAENLGVITPEVEEIRQRFGFPGMSVLQFAFGKDPQAPTFRPHNYPRGIVAYTGTHDNDTTVGWWTGQGSANSTLSLAEVEQERAFLKKYLNTDGQEIHWVLIRAIMASVANTGVIPLQDVLGEGSEARMNVPGQPAGNWRWRFKKGQLHAFHRERLRELATLYDRLPAHREPEGRPLREDAE
jgi:4-alpha-glucanotransferase